MKTIIELPPLPNLTDAERQANIDKTIKHLLESKHQAQAEIREMANDPEYIAIFDRLRLANNKN